MPAFNRDQLIHQLSEKSVWDLIVIGGGATGLGVALDAASRGYTTLLLEEHDFAKGTSSRSTKLIHGGVRYLAQGNISLIYSALQERGILFQNAPHLVKKQSFIIPCYGYWDNIKYLAGLKIYDWLSGRLSLGSSGYLNKKEIQQRLPNINIKGLLGGVEYFDGQFDDARLALNMAQTCVEKGGTVLNYFKVTALLKNKDEKINGVTAKDVEKDTTYRLQAKAVVNATGVFAGDVLQMDNPGIKPLLSASQGAHIVLNQSFLNGYSALLIPETPDGRVLYVIPWQGHALAGTTDTPMEKHTIEPVAQEQEVAFIMGSLKKYLTSDPSEKDVLSVFAGLRPLVSSPKIIRNTKELSRDHKIIVTASGLITITGGKWTTYRKMAEDTIDKVIEAGHLPPAPCLTKQLAIHGYSTGSAADHLSVYGTDAEGIRKLIKENPLLGRRLITQLPYTEAEVIWAVRNEMARTPEDVLARRLRILFLEAQAAIDAAPRVAELMKNELQKDKEWKEHQLNSFLTVAKGYLLK
jgi:glycerol-3-phosphate dehydrogenase